MEDENDGGGSLVPYTRPRSHRSPTAHGARERSERYVNESEERTVGPGSRLIP